MDVLSRPAPTADHRIPYGAGPSQFGDLWLPPVPAGTTAPLVVFFHGGWWKAEYGLEYAGHLCRALKAAGIATWSVEYRRVGQPGGGWPGTFEDAAAGFDFSAELVHHYPLDASRVITMGHSAGGHLAFWIAGRHHIPAESPLHTQASRVPLLAAVSLAGAVDLRLTIALAGDSVFAHDRQEVYGLMGGAPEAYPDRYRAGNPGDLLPLQVPQVLLQGSLDDQIPPELPVQWVQRAKRIGDHASVSILPSVDHLDIVDPESSAWPAVLAAVRAALQRS